MLLEGGGYWLHEDFLSGKEEAKCLEKLMKSKTEKNLLYL